MRRWIGRSLRSIGPALIVVGALLPLLPLVIWSFATRWFFPNLLPGQWTTAAWAYALSPTSRAVEGLVNSMWLALIVVVLCVVIGLPAARALGLRRFPGKAWVEWLILAPLIVPSLVVAMGIHIFFIRYGLADTLAGVALVHLVPSLPYFVLVMASVFANYDTALEETARTLGAGPLRVWWYVTLPAIAPGLAVATMFTFLVSWSQYISTLLIGGGRIVTLPMVLFPLVSASNHANAGAVGLLFMAPALLVLLVTARVVAGRAMALGGLGRI